MQIRATMERSRSWVSQSEPRGRSKLGLWPWAMNSTISRRSEGVIGRPSTRSIQKSAISLAVRTPPGVCPTTSADGYRCRFDIHQPVQQPPRHDPWCGALPILPEVGVAVGRPPRKQWLTRLVISPQQVSSSSSSREKSKLRVGRAHRADDDFERTLDLVAPRAEKARWRTIVWTTCASWSGAETPPPGKPRRRRRRPLRRLSAMSRGTASGDVAGGAGVVGQGIEHVIAVLERRLICRDERPEHGFSATCRASPPGTRRARCRNRRSNR